MEDGGGQSAHARGAAAAAKKKKKKKEKAEKNGAVSVNSTSLVHQPRHQGAFADLPGGITGALRERLEAIGATEPSFMIGKSLAKSDVNRGQARLLFSCKRGEPSQVAAVFTTTEMRFVEDMTEKTGGLLVAAFDRAGRRYDLTCKYLESNCGYRFISGWSKYVEGNGLGVGMLVELWWFRSRKLPNRYELRQGKEGKTDKVAVMLESGHPDGSLGLVLLHYGKDLLEPEQAGADEPDEALPPVQEMETGRHIESKTTMTAEDKLVDDGGTCAEPIKLKTRIAEDKLADDSGESAEPMIRERNTEISSKEMHNAAIGLLMLRDHLCGGGGGGGGGGKRERGEPES